MSQSQGVDLLGECCSEWHARDEYDEGSRGGSVPYKNFEVILKCNKSRCLVNFGIKIGDFGPSAQGWILKRKLGGTLFF